MLAAVMGRRVPSASRAPTRSKPAAKRIEFGQLSVNWNEPAAAFLGCMILQLYDVADLAARVEYHVPGQISDLAGPQASLQRQQHHHAVAQRMAAAIRKGEQISHVEQGKDLGLFSGHMDMSKQQKRACRSNNECDAAAMVCLLQSATDKKKRLSLSVGSAVEIAGQPLNAYQGRAKPRLCRITKKNIFR